jgi:Protein of unknown function (DUF1592)/Protein of unknown function (DUF1588)/Protein of unknown function (DUF1595)/Protein of unknown function (DUF1587)
MPESGERVGCSIEPSFRHGLIDSLRGLALSGLILVSGCSTGGGPDGPRGTAGSGTDGTGATAGTSASGGGGGSVSPQGDALPARIRRLTNAEYDASVRALLDVTEAPSVSFSFPPDTKQGPHNAPAGAAFTFNDGQRVDPVLADKLDTAAQAVVAKARASGKLGALAPCNETDAALAEACAKSFIASFGARAFRRALTNEESAGLLKAYHVGAGGYTFADGIDQVVRVLLQSPGFLYVTEIGAVGAGATFAMTADEIAASLSYLVAAQPPDADLLAAAAAGALLTGEGREAEARRLLATPAGHERFVRVVREWLGIDDVARREKSQAVYPEFASVSKAMEAESRAFIEEVLKDSQGALSQLLTADWTIADPALAKVYGVESVGSGRTSLAASKRRGILNQGAFLSVFAGNGGSHPVFRGVALMRRLACIELPDPGTQGIVVSFPPTDDTKTTRIRFEAHAEDARCAGCHTIIDNFGFTFENFDGMGRERAKENGLDVETKVTVKVGADFDGTYADSAALTEALARSTSIKTCMARQIFRSSVGRSDATVADAENAFVETWKALPPDQQGRLVDVMLAFVKNPIFVQRRTP